MDLTKTNMTRILIFVCAVIMSTCVRNPFAHAMQERSIILQTNEKKNLTSPNFPSRYDNNIDIVWHVRAPSGYRIMVHFIEFDTQPGRDFVFVYDGKKSEYQSSDHRGTFSGQTVPGNITTVGTYLWIHFTTDKWYNNYYTPYGYSYTGFKAVLTTVETTVIILQTNKTQNLTSPNFPSRYDNNIDVMWHVRAPSGYRIMVHFTQFNTEPGTDFVYVYEGKKSEYQSSGLRETLSGQPLSREITTVGAYIWIRFTSDGRNNYKGFKALIMTLQTAVIILQTNKTQNLTSPNFPYRYDNNIDVMWHVRAPSGYRIMVHFTQFYTYYDKDLVYVYDGKTPEYESSGLRETLSGQFVPRNITTVGAYLWMRFTSDGQYNHKGFKALLMTLKTAVIILQTNKTQSLTSPNFPSGYDNNIDVVWHVRAPPGYRIMVHFSEFYTESDRDLVYLYDGKTSEYQFSSLRETLSGRPVPGNITTVGAYLWIRFTSDDNRYSNYYTGFEALLMTVETTVIMLNTIETENISSPNFPVYYDNNIDVAIQVIAPPGYRVQVHFRHFETEENSDFVYIYEGGTSDFSTSTLRASLSGRSIKENVTSIGSYLWIRFASNEGSRLSGFQALLNAKITVIYLNHGNTENLQSPNYPAQYGTNLNLMWHAIAPTGHQVVVHFVDFRVETSRDFLYLYEGQTSVYEKSTLRRSNISGIYLPDNITSLGPFLWIRFTSDDGSQGDYRYTGFNISLFSAPMPVPTSLTSTMHPTITQGQPSTHASTSIKTSPSSTKVGSAIKKSPRSHRPVLAISLVAVAVILCVCVAGYVGWRKRLRHRTSQDITAFGDSRESHGLRDNPTFDSSNVHDLRMSDDADHQCGNDPYMALTTPHDGHTLQVYEPLREANSEGDGYEVPINGPNGQAGPEYGKTLHKLEVHLGTDYEIAHEYQDLTNIVVGRNNSHIESPVCELHVQPETEYEALHEYQDPGMIGKKNLQYESHIHVLQINV